LRPSALQDGGARRGLSFSNYDQRLTVALAQSSQLPIAGRHWHQHFHRMISKTEDIEFIERAISLAQEAQRSGSGAPIGCVLVLEGKIIGRGENEVEATNDPTAHAEIVAIRKASKNRQSPRFEGATMYSTLQPCGMCTMAAIWAGVSRIVYGAERRQVNEMYFEDRNLDIMDFVRDAFKDDLTLTGGLLGDRCAELYYKPDDHPPQKEQANK
jgi:tRNA(adenine34) deaminase